MAKGKPDDLPIDVINDLLDRAHVTLDLIFTCDSEGATLHDNTLSAALWGAMLQIEEAKPVADRWHCAEKRTTELQRLDVDSAVPN